MVDYSVQAKTSISPMKPWNCTTFFSSIKLIGILHTYHGREGTHICLSLHTAEQPVLSKSPNLAGSHLQSHVCRATQEDVLWELTTHPHDRTGAGPCRRPHSRPRVPALASHAFEESLGSSSGPAHRLAILLSDWLVLLGKPDRLVLRFFILPGSTL